jgi:ribonuclease Z
MALLRAIHGRLSYPLLLVELEPGESLRRDGYELRAFPLDHGVSAIGYALVEDERPGRFDPDEADRLGVPHGPARGALQHGQAVTLADGTQIHPRQVVGESRPGRKLVLAGDTAPSQAVVAAAEGADVLVHEATFTEEERERALETRHSTAHDAAKVGLAAGVKLLVLTHLSGRYFGPEIAREARAVFPDTVVPRDFDVIEIPFAERGVPSLVKGGAAPEERPRGGVGVPAAAPDEHGDTQVSALADTERDDDAGS